MSKFPFLNQGAPLPPTQQPVQDTRGGLAPTIADPRVAVQPTWQAFKGAAPVPAGQPTTAPAFAQAFGGDPFDSIDWNMPVGANYNALNAFGVASYKLQITEIFKKTLGKKQLPAMGVKGRIIASTNAQVPVGMEGEALHFVGDYPQYFIAFGKGLVAAALSAATGSVVQPSEVTREDVEAACAANQPFNGFVIGLNVTARVNKKEKTVSADKFDYEFFAVLEG